MQTHTINPQPKTQLRDVLIGVVVAVSLIGLATGAETGHSLSLAGMLAPLSACRQAPR
jgi:hypothetical protein